MRTSTRLTATAIGLALGAYSAASHAATSISTATTAPVATSSTGDLTVTSAGTITLTSGTAVTVDSDNVVDFAGTITMSASDSDSTAILIGDVANRTQALTLAGTITVTDDYTPADTTDDDILDGPWAEGSGRYGIHSVGSNPFTGDVSITSAIAVDGNQSYGIRFENLVDGDFTFDGSEVVTGDGVTGIALDKGVTGNLYLSGSIGVAGKDARAVTLGGDIGGSLIIDGSYTGTGYTNYYIPDADLADIDPSLDLLQAGPLVTVSGNVANGILFGSAVTSTDTDNTDEDGDGLTDTVQSTASLIQYGGAPALLVASSTQDITLGGLTYGSTAIDPPSVNYGLLNRGTISAAGLYPGIDSTTIQLGGLGKAVTIANGIGIAGTVSGSAHGANSTAIALMDGATTPRLDVTGTITDSISTMTTSTTTDSVTTYTTVGGGTTARAVDIAEGASLGTITIAESAALKAAATGSTANATAIRDQSNTLTEITNSGTLSAVITATDDNGDDVSDTITGSAIAIDTRGNTAGLTLTQTDTAPDDDDIAAPYIYGQILLGSGDDHVSSSGGFIYGALDFGAGTGSLTLSDDAFYAGQVTSAGDIAMDINSGATAYLLQGSSVRFSTLHVGDSSKLALTLDADNPSVPVLTGSGAAVFDSGADFTLALSRIITSPIAFTVLTASTISLGDITTSTRDGYIPYLYHAELETNAANTTLYANFRLKTQAEAGYSDNQYAALLPVLAAISTDAGAQTSLLGTTEKSTFDAVYNQYLPDYSGENLLSLAQGAQSLTRSLGNLTFIPSGDGGQYWLQEYGYSLKRETGDTAGFSSSGFSFAGGRERQVYGNQTVGAYVSLTTTSPEDNFASGTEMESVVDYSAGGYWRLNTGAFKAWSHAGLGYVSLETTRDLLTTTVAHTAIAKWNGYSVSAGAGASVDYHVGKMALIPEVTVSYYGLNEAAHTETGGGDAFDLTIGKRSGHIVSSDAVLRARYDATFIRPELWIGYRQNLSASLPDTVANFVDGDAFTLTAGTVQGGGPVAGFKFSLDNDYSYLALEGEYEKVGETTGTSLSLRTRFQF